MKVSALAVGLGLALAACGGGSAPAPSAMAQAPEGYLSPARIAALAAAVPESPVPESARAAADIQASQRMRALENSDRWSLATRHAALRPPLALAHFDCALGFRIDPAEAPRLTVLLTRLLGDANGAAERAKARRFRARPVGDDPSRAACEVLSPAARASASYPSGSAAVGMAYGKAMAVLAPDRASQVLEIGRQIGLSRLVCAAHYPSDVEAGAALGQAVFEAVAATPAFEADLAHARPEIEQARAAAETSPACAAERAALAIPLP